MASQSWKSPSGDLIACDVRVTYDEGADVCEDLGASLLVVDSMTEQHAAGDFGASVFTAPMWWIDGAPFYACAMQGSFGAWTGRECGEVAPVMCEAL